MLKVLDSSGSIPVAMMSGNSVDMGFYDECTAIAEEVDQEYIKGKYCYGGLTILLPNLRKVNGTNAFIRNYIKEVS